MKSFLKKRNNEEEEGDLMWSFEDCLDDYAVLKSLFEDCLDHYAEAGMFAVIIFKLSNELSSRGTRYRRLYTS